MTFREQPLDWRALWADLLRGAGNGLLVHDGSRAAQAALAGLEVFDEAQRRRKERYSHDAEQQDDAGPSQDLSDATDELLQLSEAERAALRRRTPDEQAAWLAEMAAARRQEESPMDHRPGGTSGSVYAGLDWPQASPPVQPRPLSANPFDNWQLGSMLPFGRDGRPNIAALRRR